MVASIIVRGLDEHVKQRLAEQAREHGRSMEAEAREILTCATKPANFAAALRHTALSVGGVEDISIPPRNESAGWATFE